MVMNEDEFNFENDESIGGNSSLVKSSQGSNTSSLWSSTLGGTKSQQKRHIKKNKKKRWYTLVSLWNGILSLLLYHLLPKDGNNKKANVCQENKSRIILGIIVIISVISWKQWK
jgi:hypothetical protein